MKAADVLREMAADAVPIFADPEREYSFVNRVSRYRRIEGGVRLSVLTNDDQPLVLDIFFVAPEVFRLRCYRAGAEPPLTSPMLVDDGRKRAHVDLTLDGDKVVLSTSALVVKVVRRPFHYGVFDRYGRKLFVEQIADLSFDQVVSFPLGFSRDANDRIAFHESWDLDVDEHFYGLGQQYGSLDKRGQRVISWTRETYGTNTTNQTYHNVPFCWSSRGYGIFLHHASKSVYELGFPSTVTGSFRVDDSFLDYFFIYGPDPRRILSRFGDLSGRPPSLPLWSFGVWLSRAWYASREQVEEIITRARESGLPVDVVHIDPLWLAHRKGHRRDACDFVWDEEAFPDLEGFARWLSERGVKLCLWENPYVWTDTEMYEEAREKGYLATDQRGEPIPSLENPPERIENVVWDFTSPEAVRYWQDKHRPLLRKGVAAFKPDYGEGVPAEARFWDGSSGEQTRNLYPLLYNRAVFDVIEEERGEALVWGRSGYAGSQRYPLNWVGDAQCTWGGMAGALRGGLSLGLSGTPFWSHDIGGFVKVGDILGLPDPTLYIRWAQWGLLSSHSRFHGIREREPWFYGSDAERIVREFARLRYRLLPYLWACAREACDTLTPVVRPMCLEFPDDPLSPALQHQYMLGPSLLVAPVFNDEGRCRFYLPAGRWHDFWTDAGVDGPQWIESVVPLERIPLYVRGDSILPFAPEQDYVGQKSWDPLRLDLRLTTRAQLKLATPEGIVDVRARRNAEAVRIDLRASGQRLELRLLHPTDVKGIAVSGDGERIRTKKTRRGVSVELTLRGRATVTAR